MSRGKKKLSKEQYAQLVHDVMTRDGWRCTVCRTRNNLQAHHIKFRSQGGEDTLDNMTTICFECHELVHRRKLIIK